MKNSVIFGLATLLLSSATMAADAPAPAHDGNGKMQERMKGRMDHMFKELDANGDGTVSKDENNAFATKKFEENDANKDGKVTKDEWDAAREKKHKEWEAKRAERNGPAKPAGADATKPAATPSVVPEVVKKQ